MSAVKCPRCSGEMEQGGVCPACGYDGGSRSEIDYIIPGRDAVPGSDPHRKPKKGYSGDEDFVFSDAESDRRLLRKRQRRRLYMIATLTLIALTAGIFFLLRRGDSPDVHNDSLRLKIGQVWTVEEQWSLTINSVTKAELSGADSTAGDEYAGIYIIDYTYTNLGYNADDPDSWGLYFDLAAYAKDSEGAQCLNLDPDQLTAPEAISPGESITCRQAIAVPHEGGFTVSGSKYSDKSHDSTEYYFVFSWIPTV